MSAVAYLDPRFVAEPLVLGWYAWSHLLSPATAALNLKNRMLPALRAYLADPQAHEIAARDPAMLGGPFFDLPARQVEAARRLMVGTVKEGGALLALASAVESLWVMLEREADGGSLVSLYAKVSPPLRGYVELVYDLLGNATFRLKESLLYRHPAAVVLKGEFAPLVVNEARRYALSTPRLDGPRLKVPLSDQSIDDLYRAYRVPVSPFELAERLQVTDLTPEQFGAYFTDQAPAAQKPLATGSWRVRYLGHACVLIESSATSILFDPVLPSTGSYGQGFGILDLPDRIDYVVLTHNHQDHVLLETLLQLRHRVGTLVVPRGAAGTLHDPSLALAMRHLGFQSVRELGELEEEPFANGMITGLPFFGEHGDLDITSKLGYLLRIGETSMMFLADSNAIEPEFYERLRDTVGPVDTLFVGMECEGSPVSWLYGAYMPHPLDRRKDQARRLNGSDSKAAAEVVSRMRCRRAFVYAMGLEPWASHISAVRFDPNARAVVEAGLFVDHCRARGVEARMLHGAATLFGGSL